MNWGEAYYDHYEKFLGPLKGRKVFVQDDSSPSIQVLEFYDFDEELSIFATIGLTHYADRLGAPAEICCLADTEFEEIQAILAQFAFFMIQRSLRIGWGVAIDHQATNPGFVERYGKAAMYLTNTFGFPREFRSVACNGQEGSVYHAFFISLSEFEFFCAHGAIDFEKRVNASGGDLVDLKRTPCV